MKDTRVFYQKMLIFELMTFILAAVTVILWMIYRVIKKGKAGKIISTLIIVLFLVHPNITQTMFFDFQCVDMRVQTDLEIVCWSEKHTFFNYAIDHCLGNWNTILCFHIVDEGEKSVRQSADQREVWVLIPGIQEGVLLLGDRHHVQEDIPHFHIGVRQIRRQHRLSNQRVNLPRTIPGSKH